MKRGSKKFLFFSFYFSLLIFLWCFANFLPQILISISAQSRGLHWPAYDAVIALQSATSGRNLRNVVGKQSLTHSNQFIRYEAFLRSRLLDYESNPLLLRRTYLDLLLSGLADDNDRKKIASAALMIGTEAFMKSRHGADENKAIGSLDEGFLAKLSDQDQNDLAMLELLELNPIDLKVLVQSSIFEPYLDDPVMSQLLALSLEREFGKK